jgi:uncharacterized protein (TIGR03083 family)
VSATADAVIDALRSGHDELVVLVADLDAHDLTAPSACSDWDLSQVLSHLGSGAEIGLGALRRAQDPGLETAPNTEIWDRWNAMTPLERLTSFLSTDETLVEAYEALDAATRRDLRIDLGFLPEPVDVATAGSFRLHEFALHSWDVRATFDPDATVAPEAVPLLIDHVAVLLGWIGKADALAGEHLLSVETTEPERRFGLSISDSVALVDEPATGATATLTLPAEAWLRLLTGRLAPDRTPASVVLTSDTVTLEDLRRVFPGY